MHSLNTAMASSSGGDAFEERGKFNVDVEPGLEYVKAGGEERDVARGSN
jgi:hypothetical protein